MTTPRQKFTSKVRRGLAQMLARNLRPHVEEVIRNCTRLGLHRGERLTLGEVAELRAALAWIEQEAAAVEVEQAPEPAPKEALFS